MATAGSKLEGRKELVGIGEVEGDCCLTALTLFRQNMVSKYRNFCNLQDPRDSISPPNFFVLPARSSPGAVVAVRPVHFAPIPQSCSRYQAGRSPALL